MKPQKRTLKVVKAGESGSTLNDETRPATSKPKKAKVKPVSVSMPKDEIEQLSLTVGKWQQFFIARSGGKATRFGRSDVLRAALKQFEKFDEKEALQALLEVFPDEKSDI